METKKYIQRAETRYANNEFESMPSIDYRGANPPYLNEENMKRIDWEKVREICNRYEFGFCIIRRTFGGSGGEFVLYRRTDITEEYYDRLSRGYRNSNEYRQLFWDMCRPYREVYHRLHECIHELDEQTDLMFDCGWCGNCGTFGSDDVRRITYSFGDRLITWKSIINWWPPSIFDTLSKLQRGIYVLMQTPYVKPQIQQSPLLADYEPVLLGKVRGLLSDEYKADFEHGKRQCDTDTDRYKALVIRLKSNNAYCGMMTISRDWMGRYHISESAPLCGECSWEMDWQDPLEDLQTAVHFIAG